MFSFSFNGFLANKYGKPPVLFNPVLADLLVCSTVVITICLVVAPLNLCMRVGTLIVATIYLQLIQNRYMFRSFTVLQCSHQHCV